MLQVELSTIIIIILFSVILGMMVGITLAKPHRHI